MKEIAIVSPGGLPIPAVRGGAVETGIQHLIEENEKRKKVFFIIFSIYNKDAYELSKEYQYTKFIYIKENLFSKVDIITRKIINKLFMKKGLKVSLIVRKKYLKKIAKYIRKKCIKTVLVKNEPSFIPLLKKTNKNITVYLQLHNDFLNKNTINGTKIGELSDFIITNSEYIKKRVLTVSTIDSSKIFINRNCVDVEKFSIINSDRLKKLYYEENIPWDSKIILYSGRLVKEKGVKELVEAFITLPKEVNFILIIMGNKWYSTHKKDKYLKELSDMTKEYSDKIIFTGYVPYASVHKYYQISDLLIVPSMWEEPAGRVVQEAQSCGTPVIASDSGGIPEYVNLKYGKIVKRDDEFINNLNAKIKNYFSNHNGHYKIEELHEYSSLLSKSFYYTDLISIINSDK